MGLLLVAGAGGGQLDHLWTVAPYVGVLGTILATTCVFTAALVWARGGLATRAAAAAALVVGLLGHGLAKTVGLPGATQLSGRPGTWELLIVGLQAVTLAELCRELPRASAAND